MTPTTNSTTKQTKKSTTRLQPATLTTEMSKEESRKNRQYIITMYAITGLIVIVGGFFIYRLFGTYIRKTNEVKAQDQYINALQQKKKDLVTLQANFQNITRKGSNGLSDADVVLRALPETADFKTLIGVFENIGAASGVQASVSTPTTVAGAGTTATAGTPSTNASAGTIGGLTSDSNVSTGSTPVPFQITVTVNGPYQQVLQFLKNTEKSLRPINFQTMTISGTSGTVQASITFETYYQGQADISNHQEPLK